MVTVVKFCLEGSATLVAVSGDAGSRGENGGRGVISVGVDGAAVVWAGGAGELQPMAGSGLPLLAMLAWKDCSAPSSTEEETGESETAMSLGDGDAGDEDLEESA